MSWYDRWVTKVRIAFGESLATSLRRRLRAAHPWTIAELREGLHGRITGTVKILDGATVQSTMTDRRCVYYKVEIIQQGGLTDTYAQRLLGIDRKSVPFVLVEAGHHALIDPTFAELLVTSTRVEITADSFHALAARPRALLERLGMDQVALQMPGRLRFTETIVAIDAVVAIAGTAARESDPFAMTERGYRDQSQTRSRMIGSKQLPLLIGDPPP